ncbi:MAG: c-type cytochrome [Planctomycetota bacterium]|jgi:hypothetical protein
MTGSITEEIDLGDLDIMLPGGNITLERDTGEDPCDGVECGDGEECVEGVCVEIDLCDGVDCGVGEECVEGVCVEIDLCDGVECGVGEECVEGVCVEIDLCDGVECGVDEECFLGDCFNIELKCGEIFCDEGETCIDLECVPDVDPCLEITCDTCETCVEGECTPLEGDAADGETFYMDNGCGACHGDNGNDGFAPDITDTNCADMFTKLSGEDHVGGQIDGITEQDAADIVAYLDSL